jgi:hypothetical protein
VSFRAGKRDGMPVAVLSEDKNEIVFSIEDNAVNNFKPSIIGGSIDGKWIMLLMVPVPAATLHWQKLCRTAFMRAPFICSS